MTRPISSATETLDLRLAYWQGVLDRVDSADYVFGDLPRSNRTGNIRFPIVPSDVWANIYTVERHRCVGVYLRGSVAYYAALAKQRKQIEAEIGRRLEWDPEDRLGRFTIWTTIEAAWRERNDWERQHSWLAETLTRYLRTFGQRLVHLKRD